MKSPKPLRTSLLLSLLLPGLGHVYCREYLFGLFVFLVTLIAAILLVATLFIDLPIWAKFFMFTLPLVFYFFTFIDLAHTVPKNSKKIARSGSTAWIYLTAGLLYQIFSPIAPGNFIGQNLPEVYRMEDNSLSPVLTKGELLKASNLDYYANSYLLAGPLWYEIPERFDIIRFEDDNGRRRTGLLIGRPQEMIQIVDGVLLVNNIPELGEPPAGLVISGDLPLTETEEISMLVATMNLGVINELHHIPIQNLIGKVDRLF